MAFITAETRSDIIALVVTMLDRAPDDALLNELVTASTSGKSLGEIADMIAAKEEFTDANPASQTAEEYATAALARVLDGTGVSAEAEAEAIELATSYLNAGMSKAELASEINAYLSQPSVLLDANFGDVAQTFVNKNTVAEYYALDADLGDLSTAELTAALASVTAEADSVTAATDAADATAAAEDVVAGQTFTLTAGADNLVGTNSANEFFAPIAQLATGGNVTNTLASGDVIDGGAGADSLDAQVMREFNLVDGEIDIQPTTRSVETVTFENRDDANTVTIDAKRMTEVDSIGSRYSDGDVVIENLTTLDNGQIRLTSDMTVTMAFTDNFNTDADASDLSVYFDEDYLNTSVRNEGSQLEIKLVNAVTNVIGGNPLFGTDGFTFSFDGTEIAVDISAIAADDTLDFSTAYQAVADLINEQLAVDYPTLTATLGAVRDAAFSIDLETEDATYEPGDEAGVYFPILITNTGPEALTEGAFQQAQVEADTNIAANQDDTPPAEAVNPISINVDLEKVGRDGEGGNLIIGGKNDDANGDTDVDQNDGIAVFNINVKGDEDQPSNLGQITSTNGALRTVNIETDSGENAEDGYAALTVRGEAADGTTANPFGGTVNLVNANAFLGDLAIGALTGGLPVGGADSATLIDVPTFTATGGGDVTLAAGVGVNGALTETRLPSAAANAYTITTAGGEDTIGVMARGGAQLTVTTGAGDDTISVDVNGNDRSGSTNTAATVVAIAGDNTVTASAADDVVGANRVTVVTGGGSDTVLGTNAGLTALTGAGNDVIIAENTGDSATAMLVNNAYEIDVAADNTGAAGATFNMHRALFLNGREVTVTVAMPEGTTGGTDEAVDFANGYELTFAFESAAELSTEVELYRAVANAINSDAVISELVTATVDSIGNLNIAYAIDGATVNAEQLVEINLSDEYASAADIPEALLAAVRVRQGDSTITADNVFAAYNTVQADEYAVTRTDATIVFDVTTLTDDDDISFTVNTVTTTLVEGTDYTGTGDLEADLDGLSVTIDGVTYEIDGGTANSLTLTQTSAARNYTITSSQIADAQGTPNTDAGTNTNGVLGGDNGTNSTTANVNVVNGQAGDDIIVLTSGANFNTGAGFIRETIAFGAGDIGNDTVVHFQSGANGDVLDFTDWLDNQVSASGSTVSRDDIAVTLVTDATIIAENSVVLTDLGAVRTALGTTTTALADITDATLLQALNGTATSGVATTFAHAVLQATLVGDTGKALMLIENNDGTAGVQAGDNLGEYLVAEVTFATNDTATRNDDFVSATIVGSIDFGETQTANFVAANFAGS